MSFFIPRKNNSCFQNVSIFEFLLNPQTSKFETLWTTLLHTRSSAFEYFFRTAGSIRKKFSQLLVLIRPSISNSFLYLLWRIETSCSSFYDFDKWHYVKSVQIRSFFWSVFSSIRTRKNSVFGHFSRSECCTLVRRHYPKCGPSLATVLDQV